MDKFARTVVIRQLTALTPSKMYTISSHFVGGDQLVELRRTVNIAPPLPGAPPCTRFSTHIRRCNYVMIDIYRN